jgi:hypothetical protein
VNLRVRLLCSFHPSSPFCVTCDYHNTAQFVDERLDDVEEMREEQGTQDTRQMANAGAAEGAEEPNAEACASTKKTKKAAGPAVRLN